MKKIKILLVSLLTVILSLFCLASCGETGKWVAKSYEAEVFGATVTKEIEDSNSYIELKNDKTIVISIETALGTISKTGTWAKGENDGEYLLTFENSTETLTIKDGVMKYSVYVLEKE